MRILVTGGAGFVGANLLSHLSWKSDVSFTVLDNERLGRRSHILAFDHRFVHGDIRDSALLDQVLPGHDTIVHLAADTRVIDSINDPTFNLYENVVGSVTLLEAARRHKVNNIIVASTGGAIIGETKPPVHEEMVAKPASPYGASKLALEGYCSAYSAAYGMNIACARFSNLYGPYSYHKGSVIAQFIRNIKMGEPLIVYGDGSQVRDYLYTGDLVFGLDTLINRRKTGVFQFGTGQGAALNEVIDTIFHVAGIRSYPVEYRPQRAGEVHSTWCKIDHAKTHLNFHPRTTLAEGIRSTWSWFNDQQQSSAA